VCLEKKTKTLDTHVLCKTDENQNTKGILHTERGGSCLECDG